MSLPLLKFSTGASGSLASFNFYDTTGDYSPTNPGGWGSPNKAITDVVESFAYITPYLSTNSPYIVNIFSNTIPFPNTDNIPFTILGTSMGYSVGQAIPSQIVSIEYETEFLSSQATTTQWVYLNSSHLCCAKQLWSKWCGLGAGCNQKDKDELLKLCIRVSGTIQAIPYALAPDCDNLTGAQDLVNWLNGICAKYTDGGCGCNQ